MAILVCGSVAFDTIMVFHDHFKHHILPEQIHILNVSFLAPEMRREFGGCAGNIAYNLSLLGERPKVMATVGDDFGPYKTRMEKLGIDTTHVRQMAGTYCAQAFITTDLDDNQITAFHPGAMMYSDSNAVGDATGVTLGIVAPDGRAGMLAHVRGFAAAGIPFIFDPGQAMPVLSAEELREGLQRARYAAMNDYELRLLCDKTGLDEPGVAAMVEALIVTRGSEGSVIHVGGRSLRFPCVNAEAIEDPTGCGDAYRAGLLYGIEHRLGWQKTGRLASLMGAIKIASRGGQNHAPGRAEIAQRYRAAYGEAL